MLQLPNLSVVRIWDIEAFDFDVDALAYFDRIETAGGFLFSYIKQAINIFVIQMKADNLWDNDIEIFLYRGGTAASGVLGLKGFVDLTANGLFLEDRFYTQYGIEDLSETFTASDFFTVAFNPNTDLDGDQAGHLTSYLRVETSDAMMPFNWTTAGGDWLLKRNDVGDTVYQLGDTLPSPTFTPTFSLGMLIGSRITATDSRIYENGIQQDIVVTDNTGNAPPNDSTGTLHLSGGSFSFHGTSYDSLGNGLSVAQVALYNANVKTLMIGLRCYVNENIYQFAQDSTIQDPKYIEAWSIGFENAGMTNAIMAKLHAVNFYDSTSATNRTLNNINPGTFNASFTNAPDLRADGMKVENTGAKSGNSGMAVDDFTTETEMSMLLYLQNPIDILQGTNDRLFGYTDGGILRVAIQINASGDDRSISYLFGSNAATLFTFDKTVTSVKGVFGFNCFDRGTGLKIQMLNNGVLVGSESTISATSSTTDLSIGSRNGTDPYANTYSGYILGEGLTDAEYTICSNWMEEVMKIRGISAITQPIQTEDLAYLVALEANSIDVGATDALADITTIQEMVNAGEFTKMDFFKSGASRVGTDIYAVLNWITATTSGSVVNAPTHRIDGTKYNGTTQSKNTGFIPSAGTNYTLNDASLHTFVTNPGTTNGGAYLASRNSTSSNAVIQSQSATTLRVRVNEDNNANDSTDTIAGRANKLLSAYRFAASGTDALKAFEAGVQVGTFSTSSNALSTVALYEAAFNVSSVISTWQNCATVASFAGNSTIDSATMQIIITNHLLRKKGYDVPLSF